MKLYGDLAGWWDVLGEGRDYAQEAHEAMELLRHGTDCVESVLELGCASGRIAAALPDELTVVLLDSSPQMLDVSRGRNPEREHVLADMRTARLDRTFDAVLLHDAVMYLTSRADLRAALATAAAHLRPGGALLVQPDAIAESYEPGLLAWSSPEPAPDGREVAVMEWHTDANPDDECTQVDFAFLLRSGDGTVRMHHESHAMGLFDHRTWLALLAEAGFEVVPHDAGPPLRFLLRRR
jgi:SAM-dependent methyltransferase